MRLDVTCWCEQFMVSVPAEMVKQGLTFPCRSLRCQEISERNGVPVPKRGRGYAKVGMPELW